MRKTLNYFLSFLVFSLFLNCSEPDDIYMGSKYLNVAKLIQVETAPSYNVNDLIYINASFSRYLPEEGFSDLLDIYKTSKTKEYSFSFTLEKKSAYGTWTAVNFGDKIVVSKGKLYKSYDDIAVCELNSLNEKYEFRAALPLLETGEFRLRVSNQLRPDYSSNSNIIIYISTTVDKVNEQGEYSFTVN
jgi:hypothetical protein